MASQFTPATLDSLRGQLLGLRPGLHPTQARDFLNQAIRQALDFKQVWAGTLRKDHLTVPDAVSSGTVTVTQGSRTVLLSGATWPDSDVVNTTLSVAVVEPGRHWVTLTSLSGVTPDSILAVDTGGSREICRVYQTRVSSILTDMDYAHVQGAAVKQSSLAGRQFRVTGSYHTFTVESVDSSTQLTLTTPWQGSSAAGCGYEIVKMYYTLSPAMKALLAIGDPQQPIILDHRMTQSELDFRDPRRSGSGIPRAFASIQVGPAGNMQWELYPIQREARQLEAMYSVQWPDMVAGNDTPPPLINPDVFVYRAVALAKMLRLSKDDVGYDPVGSAKFERWAQEALEKAASADDSQLSQQMEFFYRSYGQRTGSGVTLGSWTIMGGGLPTDDGSLWY